MSTYHYESILVFPGPYWCARLDPTSSSGTPLTTMRPYWSLLVFIGLHKSRLHFSIPVLQITPFGDPKMWSWEASISFAYDESTEAMRALAEVTTTAGVGAFVPQLVSRAGALVSVLHAETELWAFRGTDHPVSACQKHCCGVCVSWAQLGLSGPSR